MRIGLTPIQLRKMEQLSHEDIEKLIGLAKSGGATMVANHGQAIYSRLLELKFLRRKGQKIWVNFEIDGEIRKPFLGVKKKAYCGGGTKQLFRLFGKKFRVRFKQDAGALTGQEFKLASLIIKEFDLDELEMMLDNYFASATYLKASFVDFYMNRNKMYKLAKAWHQDHEIKPDKNTDPHNGW